MLCASTAVWMTELGVLVEGRPCGLQLGGGGVSPDLSC